MNGNLEGLREADGKIDFQLAKKAGKYAPLIEAGNVRETEDGIYEVIKLPGLTESEDKIVRMAVEQDNEFTRKAYKTKDQINNLIPAFEHEKEGLEEKIAMSERELLEEHGAPEELSDQVLREIESSRASHFEEITEGESSQHKAEISEGDKGDSSAANPREESPATIPGKDSPATVREDPNGQISTGQDAPQEEVQQDRGKYFLDSARESAGDRLAEHARAARAERVARKERNERAVRFYVPRQQTSEPELGD